MGSLPQNITQDRLTQQDITRKMSWVMVMGLFDLMAESGPGDENIDEIAVDRDENIINNLFNETLCQTISKKQNKKIRNYTNHNPVVHLRNEEQVENQYQQHQHQHGFKGSIVQSLQSLLSSLKVDPVTKLDLEQAIMKQKLDFEQADSCFFDEEEEVAEQDNNPVELLDCDYADSCFLDQEEKGLEREEKKCYKWEEVSTSMTL